MTGPIAVALDVATVLVLLGLVCACGRLLLGPTRADRVVAVDLVTVLLVALASLSALRFDDSVYLDIGLTLALVGFLATVAFARYVECEPPTEASPDGGPESAPPRTDDAGRAAP